MTGAAAFTVLQQAASGPARLGQLNTPHGPVETPQFMPVGTRACVRTLAPDELAEAGVRIILANTYHLLLRPGPELIQQAGGLHRFMGWAGPILTDSGGFQVFSLAPLRRVSDEGVLFRSHVDGSLQSAAAPDGSVRAGSGWTELFIYPGYVFRVVDVLVTNFHLPRSTLLMLVCAFGGTERVLAAYRTAVEMKYRFYSFGDAMLILP